MLKKQRFLMLVLLTVALIMSTLSGCSSKTEQQEPARGVGVENGIIDLEGTTISFGKNSVADGDDASMRTIEATEDEVANGLTSKLYELTLNQEYTEPLTVSFPVPEDFTGTAEEALLVGLGVECEYDSGRVGIEYFYFPAEIADGLATASFIPAELIKGPLYMGAGEGTATPVKKFVWTLGVFTSSTAQYEGGHFRLYYPTKVGDKFFHAIVGTDGTRTILDDLEAVYEKYQALGYKYKESDFPMNVHIKKIDDKGSYHSLFKDITLNIDNFTDKYVPGSLNPLLWHEFFHYVQVCYTGIFSGTEWIDEATASYYEASAKDVTYTTLTAQYFEKQFSSALPAADSAQDGYARSPLISFLSKKMGGDAWIKNAYEKGGSNEALISQVGDPSGWAHEYYTALASGQVGQESTYTLHKNLSTGVYDKDVGTSLKLSIPDADEQVQKGSDEEIPLGSATVTMNGQGSRLIAIIVDKDELKKLPDAVDPKVECKGASVTVISAIGSKASNQGSSLTGLKDSANSKAVYLVVVTSKAAAGTSSSFEVKVKLPVKKIDYSGTYTGILNVTETGKDIEVTTVVTYEKDFGDGSYYKIVCSNDETGSTYINGSYFVRWSTGEANIAGAKFVFSADGTSFSASMRDYNDKEWGVVNCQR